MLLCVETAQSAGAGAERGIESWDLDAALDSIWTLVTRANRYIEENAPWELAKVPDRRERLGTVLYNVTEAVRILAVLPRSLYSANGGRRTGTSRRATSG